MCPLAVMTECVGEHAVTVHSMGLRKAVVCRFLTSSSRSILGVVSSLDSGRRHCEYEGASCAIASARPSTPTAARRTGGCC